MAPKHGAATLLKQSKDYEAYCNLEKRPLDIPRFSLGDTEPTDMTTKGRKVNDKYVVDKHYGEIFCRFWDPEEKELCPFEAPMLATSLRKHVLDDHKIEWEQDASQADKGGKRKKEEIVNAIRFYKRVMHAHRDAVDLEQEILDANNTKSHEARKKEKADAEAEAQAKADAEKAELEKQKEARAQEQQALYDESIDRVRETEILNYLQREPDRCWPLKKRPARPTPAFIPTVHKTRAKTIILGTTGKNNTSVKQVCASCKESRRAKACMFEENATCELAIHYGRASVALAAYEKVSEGFADPDGALMSYPGELI